MMVYINNFKAGEFGAESLEPYWIECTKIIDSCPVTLILASNFRGPYPFKLQNVKDNAIVHCDRSTGYILDSGIGDESLTNDDVLEEMLRFEKGRGVDFVIPKDRPMLPGNSVESEAEARALTTEAIRDFLPKWAHLYDYSQTSARPLIPLQPPHDTHYRQLLNDDEIRGFIDHYDLNSWCIGGIMPKGTLEQVGHVERFRSVVGPKAYVHGLGLGMSLSFVQWVRQNPDVFDSVDVSTPSQLVSNNGILSPSLSKEDWFYPRGKGASTMNGLTEFLMAMRVNYLQSPYTDFDKVVSRLTELDETVPDRLLYSGREAELTGEDGRAYGDD